MSRFLTFSKHDYIVHKTLPFNQVVVVAVAHNDIILSSERCADTKSFRVPLNPIKVRYDVLYFELDDITYVRFLNTLSPVKDKIFKVYDVNCTGYGFTIY